LTYVVLVSATPSPASLTFNPLSPALFVVGDPAISLSANGQPAGGTYTSTLLSTGGTGGSFSPISPLTGVFAFSGAGTSGNASLTVTYTPATGSPVSATYSVTVLSSPPPTGLDFIPHTPAFVTVGAPSLSLSAIGSPSGGIYTLGTPSSGGTGGTFGAISPTTGAFSFSGTTSAGTASVDVTYTPASGTPLTLTYRVIVSATPPSTSLTFSPPASPTLAVGAPALTIRAIGSPTGGTYSLGTSSTGGTGASFGSIDPLTGFFSFSSPSSAGTAFVDVTYTPSAGSPLTLRYSISVTTTPPPSSLSFTPVSPAFIVAGDPDLTISANGSPAGGIYTSSTSSSGGTGGAFSGVSPSTGVFSFFGATNNGTATQTIIYTPPSGTPVSATYQIFVSTVVPPLASLDFLPHSPAVSSVGTAFTIVASGSPAGGTYSSFNSSSGGTGGSFSPISAIDGSFSFSGATASGTASISITYTPVSTAPITLTYQVIVTSVPPPASLTFLPTSPEVFVVGSSPLSVTASGQPVGGTYSSTVLSTGGTGGTFSSISSSTGIFSFSGAVTSGSATLRVTYTPPSGASISATYQVNVASTPPATSLDFSPTSPITTTVGAPSLSLNASGSPSGGTYSFGAISTGGTGGTFGSISPTTGAFSFSGTNAGGTASVEVIYTLPSGSFVSVVYTINVLSVPPPASLIFLPDTPSTLVAGAPALTISALGSPAGGTYGQGTVSTGSTGGSFSSISSTTGVFSFSGSTSAGNATVEITYTPLSGASVAALYHIIVLASPPSTSLSFNPSAPVTVVTTDLPLTITATGFPAGGVYSSGSAVLGTTGGSFSAIGSSTGIFTFDNATNAGVASIAITYTPSSGAPVTSAYALTVSTIPVATTLTFTPPSPATFVTGSAPLTISANGSPAGGVYSRGSVSAGGTGGTFSAIGSTTGTLTFSGAISAGSASTSITYTAPSGAPLTLPYVVSVVSTPPTTSLTFIPATPAVTTGVTLNITAIGTPSGGLYTSSSASGGTTGGSFSSIDPISGTFSFSGSTSAGMASLTITYTPASGAPLTVVYSITVTSSPLVPLFVCDSSTCSPITDSGTITASLVVTGGPLTITDLNVLLDITHTFTSDLDIFLISPLGTRVELTSDNGGSLADLYSPIILDQEASASVTTVSTAGGTFRAEGSLSTFNGENANGTWILEISDDADVDTGILRGWCLAFDGVLLSDPGISCVPSPTSLTFTPASPSTLVVGSPPLLLTAIGSPSGGLYSSGASRNGTTGGSFSSIDSILGTFDYSASTASGIASIDITYTPPGIGAPLTLTYTITVVSFPPTTSLTFSPTSPATLLVGSPALSITATGSPSAGMYSSSSASSGGTGGSFSAVGVVSGIFTFSGASSAGSASIDITYAPPSATPITLRYTVVVTAVPPPTSLSFNPLSPLLVVVGSPAIGITATGSPSGGTYSSVSTMGGPTGGSFSAIHPSLGTFTFSSASAGGSESVDVTYTPLSGSPVTLTYSVTVATVPPPASLTFLPSAPALITVGDPSLMITAIGSPAGGTYSSGSSMGGSTGGSFSGVSSTSGVFTFSGSTSAGTASLSVTYTPLTGAPVTQIYSVSVVAVPPPTSLVFTPASPASITAGDPVLTISATGIPSGGSYSSSSATGGTSGGVFSAISSSNGTFSFSGTSTAGTASISITYSPLTGSPLTLSYVINVSSTPPVTSLNFSPSTPLTLTAGDPSQFITAIGSPAGGTYTSVNAMGGTTGGTFSSISPSSGVFSYSGSTSAGTAFIDVTYTPLSGSPLTLTYTVSVTAALPATSLSFLPLSPALITAGASSLPITATGTPAGGSYSSANADGGGTGASFSAIGSSSGAFTFSGSTSAGTASVEITYTPLSGTPLTLTYIVLVSATPPPASLTFVPASPASFTAGDPSLALIAVGSPAGGTYSTSGASTGGTGASFSAIGTSSGAFSFSGATLAGTASISVTYTPLTGAPVSALYVVNVSLVPPPTQLIFIPTSPTSLVAGDPPISITAIGNPSGGSYSNGPSMGGTTGGLFSSVSSSLGTFTFSNSVAAGTASVDITYTPLSGSPITLLYTVEVLDIPPPSSLSFTPASPSTITVADPSLSITAVGFPAGGMYSSAGASSGGTGGSFSAISSTAGTFSFFGTTATGTASIDITYTPVSGSPVTLTYSVVVVAVPPPASLSFLPTSPASVSLGDPDLSITATGSPAGGTYSNGAVISGGTGGTFSTISSTTGVFTFSGFFAVGTASVGITYTPLSGAPVTLTYSVTVSALPPTTSLAFIPTSPASFTLGDPDLSLLAIGSPSGGMYSNGATGGGTGGSFSAITPFGGSFTFSGATSAGTATVAITYTPPTGTPLTLVYSVTVFTSPPSTALTFAPAGPASITAGDPVLSITATGTPSGGTYSSAVSMGGTTGGSFSAISPSTGLFTFSGSTSAGTASIGITYTPVTGSPLTLTYSVSVGAPPVAALSFAPTSPLSIAPCGSPVTITAMGSPLGGTYSSSSATGGTTGGVFSSIDSVSGVFTFSGAFDAGVASLSITYTPPAGLAVTLSYTINVSAPPSSSLAFTPASPATLFEMALPLSISTAGLPVGGTFSNGVPSLGGTGGVFSTVNPTTGVFTFSGSTSPGTASIGITYTPSCGSPVSATFTVVVMAIPATSLTFVPPSPLSITACDPLRTIIATGSPSGGTFMTANAVGGGTGASFSAIGASTGVFTFSGAINGGTASIDVSYVPPLPSFPLTLTYTVVVASPAVASLGFSPSSPASFTIGGSTLMVTALGAPSGGVFSRANEVSGGTGGSFSSIGVSSGMFTFSGASTPGTASIEITYTPSCGIATTLVYRVSVVSGPPGSLSFSPITPLNINACDGPVSITASGSPFGGTYSTSNATSGGTGGSFSSIGTSSGIFGFSGSSASGTASVDITYTPPLPNTPVTITYSVVVGVPPSAGLSFAPASPGTFTIGGAPLSVTATGTPSGGSYSTSGILLGGTGGSFSSIGTTSGVFTFSGASAVGSARVDVTYTPSCGVPITVSYNVTVVVGTPGSIVFSPATPRTITACAALLTVTAAGTPSGGTFSTSGATGGTTGGSFSAIGTSSGVFTFSGSSAGGTATVSVTYTPLLPNTPITVVYTVIVSAPPSASLGFTPATPSSFTIGSGSISITALGAPSAGTYSTSNISLGGTGGSFGAIGSTSGMFSFSGGSSNGVATVDVTYTPNCGAPATATYTVNVISGPPGSLSFSPITPTNVTACDPPLSITATGFPSGGTYSRSNEDPGTTGGSFTPISPTLGTFSFSGATSTGTASLDITYIPPLPNTPVTVTYSVIVSAASSASLSFSPPSPTTYLVGGPVLTVTVTGTPAGGVYSTSNISLGGTGGTFSAIGGSSGIFTFSGATVAGTARVDVTYTPICGIAVTVNYTVSVATGASGMLSFSPAIPASVSACEAPITITATGSPSGGVFSSANASDGGTGGIFSAISASAGTFTFSGATAGGTATVDITYTPISPTSPITATYSVLVGAPPTALLSFVPSSPGSYTVSGPALSIFASGTPLGGTFSTSGSSTATTGGSFSAIGTSTGVFSFSGATSAGTASIDVTYTPVCGTATTVNYSVSVMLGTPGMLMFSPATPTTITACDGLITIIATGSPSGGTYSSSNEFDGGTGGSFTSIDMLNGDFSFSGSSSPGTATLDITYLPPVPATPVTVTYEVVVSAAPTASLGFSPASPASFSLGASPLSITAMGSPSGGTYSLSNINVGGTGGIFSGIGASSGVFTYSSASAVGSATLDITYTPLCGVAVTVSYTVSVSSGPAGMLSFSPSSPASISGCASPLMIASTGTPSGGVFTVSNINTGTTGGSFSGIGASSGAFTFSGSTTAGTATLDVTYTPPFPASAVTATYTVSVSAPPTASVMFSPSSPATFLIGGPVLTTTTMGTPSGGTFSSSNINLGGTGGSFSAIGASSGTFTFSSAGTPGTATLDITYTPVCGVPSTVTYSVSVMLGPPGMLSFSPASPTSITACSMPLMVTAMGTPSGGIFSSTNAILGGTGGAFSAIGASSGVFTFSGAVAGGTASIDITYTPTLPALPATLTYTVMVSAPPMASLIFTPTSPSSFAIGGPALGITAIGSPSGGTYSTSGFVGGGTGGSFSGIGASSGAFSFSGASVAGTASIDVTYTPLCGIPAILTYSVTVVIGPPGTLSFSPISPASITACDASLLITATGSPSGGTYSTSNASTGGTGGTFSGIGTSTGMFTFSGSSFAGTASIDVTYTPPLPSTPVTSTYTINVASPPVATLGFTPVSPASFMLGGSPLSITATGSPVGGTYSTSNISLGGTGGSFSAIGVSTGVFTYSSATAAGTATVDITYTPLCGTAVTLTYTVTVSSGPPGMLSFSPTSPTSITGCASPLTITATGSPSGGTYSTSSINTGTTGGSFSAIGTSSGILSFSGTTSAGVATVNVTYTPPFPATAVTLTYTINVSAPPTASLVFSPTSPATFLIGGPVLSVTAMGTPSGGIFSSSNISLGGTGGSFSAIGASSGVFTFSGAGTPGTASIDITYTPLCGLASTLTYSVSVMTGSPGTLSFSPTSPASISACSMPLTVTAMGTPSGGTFSSANASTGGTGGVFSGIGASSGIFTFSGAGTAGTATIDITYTPILPATPSTLTYTITVSAPPTASLSFSPTSPSSFVIGGSALAITATGSPSGGTYSTSGFVGGGTGGTFSAIGASSGAFSFSGATVVGTASINVTYTPSCGVATTLAYSVMVVVGPPGTLSFSPTSPASISACDSSLMVTAIGSPSGGTYSTSNVSTGGTGGTFSAIGTTTGIFTFSGSTTLGSASIDVTYTPPLPNTPVTSTYVITVGAPPMATLGFSPPSGSSIFTGAAPLAITATGSPSGGTYSTSNFSGGGTGGTFSAIGASTGAFTFSGATSAGTASIDVMYVPLCGTSVTVTYGIVVNSAPMGMLSFSPAPTPTFVPCDPPLAITATGTPSGGTYSTSNFVGGGTGGTFSAIGVSNGMFTFSGATVAGSVSIDVTYTPPMPATPITLTYPVTVDPPPVATLGFTPSSPASILVGASTLFIQAIGTPGGGTYSSSNFVGGGTGGTFSAIGSATGAFSYMGSTAAGTASIDITYTPLCGVATVSTYMVTVTQPSGLTFAPTSGVFVACASSPLMITATGTPSGGTYSTSNFMGGGTGGTFSAIGTSSGVFSFSGAITPGTASIDVTYTPPTGSPLTMTFTVTVTMAPTTTILFSPTSPASVPTGGSVMITATGSPTGGTFSTSGFMGGGTGGTFSAIGAMSGVMTFSGATTPGTASISVTYTPTCGTPATAMYTVTVTAVVSITFTPTNPTTITCGASALMITATGSPSGGSFSSSMESPGTTGGMFLPIDGVSGVFGFFGTTSGGTASILITYTPPTGSPLSVTYTITVFAPPSSLSFIPASPGSFTIGGPALTVTATGSPTPGTFSSGAPSLGGTGGMFTAIGSTSGIFSFSGATTPGTATIPITYTPSSCGSIVMMTYVVTVGGPPPVPVLACASPMAAIPDGTGMLTSTITLSGGPILIADLNVGLNIPHTTTSDLVVTLTSPLGTVITLTSGNGGATADLYAKVRLDDAAAASITTITAPDGTFRPAPGMLSAFNGEDADGMWTLRVTDTVVGGTGTLVEWCLAFDGEPLVFPTDTMITFTPDTLMMGGPGTMIAPGAMPLVVTFTGSPTGGTFTSGTIVTGGTGGTFDVTMVGMGTFTFSGTTGSGTASIEITYTPPMGMGSGPLTLTYTIIVALSGSCFTTGTISVPIAASSGPTAVYTVLAFRSTATAYFMSFSVPTPATVGVGGSVMVDTTILNGSGMPPPTGSFAITAYTAGTTGAPAPTIDPTTGIFTFAGSTAEGTATLIVAHRLGTFITNGVAVYNIFVDSTPPIISMTFSPPSPATTVIPAGGMSPTFTVTTSGSPGGGSFGGSAFIDPATGGTFSGVSPSAGTFTYGGASESFVISNASPGLAFTSSHPTMLGGILYGLGSASTLAVGSGEPPITDVRLRLDILHTFVGDLDITLTSPMGTSALVVMEEGMDGDDMGIILDDAASATLASYTGTPGNPLPFPSFRPSVDMLSDFDGEDPTGTWALSIIDTSPFVGDGTLREWALCFNGAMTLGF
jgi:subtilisin-like proprotein convertase family protein